MLHQQINYYLAEDVYLIVKFLYLIFVLTHIPYRILCFIILIEVSRNMFNDVLIRKWHPKNSRIYFYEIIFKHKLRWFNEFLLYFIDSILSILLNGAYRVINLSESFLYKIHFCWWCFFFTIIAITNIYLYSQIKIIIIMCYLW